MTTIGSKFRFSAWTRTFFSGFLVVCAVFASVGFPVSSAADAEQPASTSRELTLFGQPLYTAYREQFRRAVGAAGLTARRLNGIHGADFYDPGPGTPDAEEFSVGYDQEDVFVFAQYVFTGTTRYADLLPRLQSQYGQPRATSATSVMWTFPHSMILTLEQHAVRQKTLVTFANSGSVKRFVSELLICAEH